MFASNFLFSLMSLPEQSATWGAGVHPMISPIVRNLPAADYPAEQTATWWGGDHRGESQGAAMSSAQAVKLLCDCNAAFNHLHR